MILFPSIFKNQEDVSRLLYYTAIWSGGRTSEVRLQGFDTLRTHVSEISRSPSSGRISGLTKQMNLLSGSYQNTIYIPPDIATGLFRACITEAPALLELGYPRDEPAILTTSLPPPGVNSIRTQHQIRSAVHHLGGDFDLLKALMRTIDPSDPSLDISFCIWPPSRIREGHFALRLGYSGQSVPSLVILSREMTGYALLCCWDLALRLRDTEKIPVSETDFESFAAAFSQDQSD
jgi:hypothetical protein